MSYFTRSFSKAGRYGHAVGRVMCHESTLLTSQLMRRLVEPDFEEVLAVTSETVYGPYLEGASVSHEVESGLLRFLADEYRFMDQICAGTLVTAFMHLKYDYHNLKVILKSEHLGDGEDDLLSDLGSVGVPEVRAIARGELPLGAPAGLWLAAIAAVPAGLAADPQYIDTVVDRAFLENRLALAKEEGSQLLARFCRAAIDLANLHVLLRGNSFGKEEAFFETALAEGGQLNRKLLLKLSGEPYPLIADQLLSSRYGHRLAGLLERGEEKARLTSLDRATDEYLLAELSRFSAVSMGPERIIRYMTIRENEISVLRVILIGKLYGLAPAVIESRLPFFYIKEAVR